LSYRGICLRTNSLPRNDLSCLSRFKADTLSVRASEYISIHAPSNLDLYVANRKPPSRACPGGRFGSVFGSLRCCLAEDLVHARAAHRTGAFHRAARGTLAGHRDLRRVFHLALCLALDAITDDWIHINVLILVGNALLNVPIVYHDIERYGF